MSGLIFMCMMRAGGEGDGIWYMPDILVNTVRPGEDPHIGVVREVLTVCTHLIV